MAGRVGQDSGSERSEITFLFADGSIAMKLVPTFVTALVLLTIGFGGQCADTAPRRRYQIIYLHTPVGGWSYAAAINNRGQVVGSMYSSDGSSRAFLWEQGRVRELGSLGGNDSEALSVNDQGIVVGQARAADGTWRAGAWRGGEVINLDPDSPFGSIAYDINKHGDVVGAVLTAQEETRGSPSSAVLWRRGQLIDLGTFGDAWAEAIAINDRSEVLVETETGASVWSEGRVRRVPRLMRVHDLNNRGQVAGDVRVAGSAQPFLAGRSRARRLPTLYRSGHYSGRAYGINDRGEVVGRSGEAGDPLRAVLWRHRRITVLPVPPGTENSWASDVNDRGWVVGGVDERPVIWKPVRER